MGFEDCVRALLQSVPELEGRIHPLAAAKAQTPPFAVFMKSKDEAWRTLGGVLPFYDSEATVDVVARNYDELEAIERKIWAAAAVWPDSDDSVMDGAVDFSGANRKGGTGEEYLPESNAVVGELEFTAQRRETGEA